MKNQIYFILFFITLTVAFYSSAQESYLASGTMRFISKTPVGDIEAVSDNVKANYNSADKKLEIEVPIRSFIFDKVLMQQYFNEKYMESERFPKAYFEGTFDQPIDFSKSGSFPAAITGKLTIHGVSKKRTVNGTITVNNKKATIISDFIIVSADHNIKSPDKIYEKVGDLVEVSFKAILMAAPKSYGKNNQ